MERCEILQFKESLWIIEKDLITERSRKAPKFDHKRIPQQNSFLISSFSIDIKSDLTIDISSDAYNCDFLRFIENTSIGIPGGFANKLTCIGFLLSASRNESDPKIILAYNYSNAVGSNGKSILLRAIEQIKPTLVYDGQYKGLRRRNHESAIIKAIKGLESEQSDILAIDDTPRTLNMNTVKLLSHHFGDIPTLVTSRCEKLKNSDPDIALMPFSNSYNQEHRPMNDFGCSFFNDWSADQWNLFFNLMSHCIRLYLKHGIVKTTNHA